MSEADVRAALEDDGEPVTAAAVLGADCPVRALGHREDRYYFLDKSGQVRAYRARDFSTNGVLDLFGGGAEWLIANYPPTGDKRRAGPPWDGTTAVGALMQACHAEGLLDLERDFRGPGVWAADGGLDVHLGDAFLEVRFDEEGRPVHRWAEGRGWISGGKIYAAAPPEARPADVPIPAAEVVQLATIAECWPWRSGRIDAELFVGHLALSCLVGAAPIRPPLLIAGDTGTGKTTLIRYGRGVLGGWEIYYDDPTKAGVRADIGNHARPVIVDEFEVKERNTVALDLVELMRFTYTRDGGRWSRAGSHAGAGVAEAHFAAISVEPPTVRPQDANRRILLELDKRLMRREPAETIDDYIAIGRDRGPKVRRRMMDRWRDYPEAFRVLRRGLQDAGFDSRRADTFAANRAAYLLLVKEGPIVADDASAFAAALKARDTVDAEAELRAHEECWLHLVSVHVERYRGGERVTLGELLGEAMHGNAEVSERALETLKRHGVTIVVRPMPRGDPAANYRWIAIAGATHAGLKSLFVGTRWAGGAWKTALRNMDGAWIPPNAIKFNGTLYRSVIVPGDLAPKPAKGGEDENAETPAR